MSDFLSNQPADSGTSHLSSNNPFRTRAVSPSVPLRSLSSSPFFDPPASTSPRPVSRNPFLDPEMATSAPTRPSGDRLINFDEPTTTDSSQKSIVDFFSSLTMDDNTNAQPATASPQKAADIRPVRSPFDSGSTRPDGTARGGPPPPPRGKNIPLRPSPPSAHHPSRSQEEALRSRKPSGIADSGPAGGSSSHRPPHSSRPRRNSESSVIDVHDKKTSKSGEGSRDSRRREHDSRRSARRHNDIIDQMDASSIFGTVFHHDGPFDALNPHRNRKGSRRAPMQAFPKDSLNNVIGGSGPLNSRPDHRTFMGQGEDEAFRDFSGGLGRTAASSGPPNKFGTVGLFDPLQRGSVLHGDQTMGLGTSTFLEGTPAARAAIQRREAERAQDIQENPLQRKKSLAQRFRSINRGPRDQGPARAFSTEGAPISSRNRSGSGRLGSFDANDEYDPRKGEDVITVRRKGSATQPLPPSPPGAFGLERRSTTEGASGQSSSARGTNAEGPSTAAQRGRNVSGSSAEESPQKSGGGLLARVKSLKGGRRPAPPPPIAKDL